MCPPMNDTTWISTCSRDVARASMEFLGDVCEEFDMLHDPIIVSPYIHGMGIGQAENVRRARTAMANMLVKRSVLKSAEYFHERGSYGDARAEGIRIVADEATVREAHRLLRERVFGPRPAAALGPLPAPGPADHPMPVAPTMTVSPTITVNPTFNVPIATVAPVAPVAPASATVPDSIVHEVKKEWATLPVKIIAGVLIALMTTWLLGGFGWVWKVANSRQGQPRPAAAESTAVKKAPTTR